jgi:hypothetical protein
VEVRHRDRVECPVAGRGRCCEFWVDGIGELWNER